MGGVPVGVGSPSVPGASSSEPRERAVVVDELALARAGITAVLRARGIDVVAQTRSGREAASAVVLESADLVVIGAPADVPVVDTVRRIARLRPVPAMIVLLPPAHEHELRYLLALGAAGVALRSGDVDELGSVVDAVMKGDRLVASGLHGALAGAVRPPPGDDDDLLTSREREVLALVAEGRSNREIASALSVTLATVKSHLVRIYAKLEASNRNEALGRAVARGLLR